MNTTNRSGYEAFVLDDATRARLAKLFVPSYPEWVGHHVTNRFGVLREDNRSFGSVHNFEVVGYAHKDGIEALVVSRNGSTKRPDGKVYHLTWSLDRSKGWKPVDSNRIIAEGYTSVPSCAFTATFEYLN